MYTNTADIEFSTLSENHLYTTIFTCDVILFYLYKAAVNGHW